MLRRFVFQGHKTNTIYKFLLVQKVKRLKYLTIFVTIKLLRDALRLFL